MSRTIDIIVKPNSGKSMILDFDPEKKAFPVLVRSRPEHGKANLEVIKLFSRRYKQDIKIISGLKSKKKTIAIG